MVIYDRITMTVDTSERHLQFKINKDSLRHVVDDSPMAIYDRMSMIVKSSPLRRLEVEHSVNCAEE
jgi:hypothetical protein